jgi:hypothetical protein
MKEITSKFDTVGRNSVKKHGKWLAYFKEYRRTDYKYQKLLDSKVWLIKTTHNFRVSVESRRGYKENC